MSAWSGWRNLITSFGCSGTGDTVEREDKATVVGVKVGLCQQLNGLMERVTPGAQRDVARWQCGCRDRRNMGMDLIWMDPQSLSDCWQGSAPARHRRTRNRRRGGGRLDSSKDSRLLPGIGAEGAESQWRRMKCCALRLRTLKTKAVVAYAHRERELRCKRDAAHSSLHRSNLRYSERALEIAERLRTHVRPDMNPSKSSQRCTWARGSPL
jgi:hypothetical protein